MGRFLVILALISSTAWSQDKPEEILNAVVGVNAKIRPNARSAESLGTQRRGTGVLIRDGYVLTIGYLIIEAEAIQVTGADGRTVPATLAGYDHASGFGLLKLVGPSPGKPLSLGDSRAAAVTTIAGSRSASAFESPSGSGLPGDGPTSLSRPKPEAWS